MKKKKYINETSDFTFGQEEQTPEIEMHYTFRILFAVLFKNDKLRISFCLNFNSFENITHFSKKEDDQDKHMR